jgi:hypothetical protein
MDGWLDRQRDMIKNSGYNYWLCYIQVPSQPLQEYSQTAPV